MLKLLTVWITTNCGEFLKRWEYQTTLPVSWDTCLQVKKKTSKPDKEQLTGSKLRKEYNVQNSSKEYICSKQKGYICHPVYLTYMQNTSWNAELDELQAGIKVAGRNINNIRYADDTTLMAESEEELKSFLMGMKEESEKSGFKAQH